MTIRTIPKRFFAGLLLLILLAAHVGQKIHIYHEDKAHFAAFSGDLVPDNGARSQVVERCGVDDFGFFPCLEQDRWAHCFYSGLLGVLPREATRCKCAVRVQGLSLRAPPAA